ncbi:MAG TPA: ABC transporter substrate-binding protein [Stackebrandtia sp.]|jgi:peptide/nickel transport system substrate-binding protein|uniref:ABC transporter substrate-binding protein n=1 Tax=Stackebrandtia sp. TaxID=2023065 RepID=UPI002D3FF238|nr:ABC transporter substrate-binding protein [Stackebrandtia sp.]HZE38124.1 ABC transporter substrate-binding protein [Stackebrandtia sp.]
MRLKKPKTYALLAAIPALALAATTACTASATHSNDKTAFVFAGAGDPKSLDPSLASDGETFRVTRQVFEGLLTHKSGGTKIVGQLAKTWDTSKDGKTWTFHLHDNVKFHDGSKLTAQVVCDNYDRWFNWKGTYQNAAVSTYWQDTFGGFKHNESKETPPPNYNSCTAKDDLTPVIKVNHASARLPGGFTLASMGIHSPKSLKTYAKESAPKGDDPAKLTYPDYSQKAGEAAGTGPYKYKKWDHGESEVTLTRFDGYWNAKEKAHIKTMIVKTIPKENDRKQALLSDEIQGYDLVAPQDVSTLKDKGMQVPKRGVFNLMYLGMDQKKDGKKTPLADKRVREAIAQAINKKKIIKQIYPPGATVAKEFLAPTLDGYSDDVKTYDYNKDAAKKLLKDAGQSKLKIDLCEPTDVTRPYLPDPEDVSQNIKADLEAIGVTVTENPMKWNPDYQDAVNNGKCSLYILGWTGDYNEAYNFLGTWFGTYKDSWGFKDKKIFDLLDKIDNEPSVSKRKDMYVEANNLIMKYLPGVPIAHSPPSIAFASYVNPPKVSPLTSENFAETSFK